MSVTMVAAIAGLALGLGIRISWHLSDIRHQLKRIANALEARR